MKHIHRLLPIWFAALPALAQGSLRPIESRTASGHPMHYRVSLPANWTPERQWPVVIVIPDAERRFDEATREFSAARGERPFVLVTPLVLSGGGAAQQHMSDFDYSPDVWARIATDGNCKFDDDGLTAVIADVRQRFHTEDKVFMTGWEAGGHVVLAQVLNHPERFRAAAVATPNFISRCVNESRPARAKSSLGFPVRMFHGSLDTLFAARSTPLNSQWERFDALARSLGYADLAPVEAPNRGHGNVSAEVMAWFATLVVK
jgi:dienelactone hydrolase